MAAPQVSPQAHAQSLAAAQIRTASYVANLHGLQANAQVSFEPLREFTIMAREIRSSVAY